MPQFVTFLFVSIVLAAGASAQEVRQDDAAIADTATLFDTSGAACYHRLKGLGDLKQKGFASGSAWDEIGSYKADAKLFGVPTDAWDEPTAIDFFASLDICTEDPTMRSIWDAAFLLHVQQKFPLYLAEKKRHLAAARRYHEVATSQTGMAVACFDLLRYPATPGADGTRVFFPFEQTLGKKFLDFTDDDYAFLAQKASACAEQTVQIQDTYKLDLTEDVLALRKLSAAIAQQWKPIQREQIDQLNALSVVKAEAATVADEKERRAKAPTLIERFADYIGKAGVIGIIFCLGMTAKQDKRYKTGYKNNWVAPRWLTVTFFSSLGLFILGGLIG